MDEAFSADPNYAFLIVPDQGATDSTRPKSLQSTTKEIRNKLPYINEKLNRHKLIVYYFLVHSSVNQ